MSCPCEGPVGKSGAHSPAKAVIYTGKIGSGKAPYRGIFLTADAFLSGQGRARPIREKQVGESFKTAANQEDD